MGELKGVYCGEKSYLLKGSRKTLEGKKGLYEKKESLR